MTDIRKYVRQQYGKLARGGTSCCGPATGPASCGPGCAGTEELGRLVGYSKEELTSVPEGSNLGLGCGNPTALASLQAGETVVDLGAGAGFDCFLAAARVGADGKVIGVDMTPEMIEKARANAEKSGYDNVEFRLGEIESLPVADEVADVVISNCVINLSPDKDKVFRESFRVLKPGGRLLVSDIVLLRKLPESLKDSIEAYAGCIGGAMLKDDYLAEIASAGFIEVLALEETSFPAELIESDPAAEPLIASAGITVAEAIDIAGAVCSIKVEALKPTRA